ncbi:alpha-tocopherol transfer protein isoform X2 [Leptinotarsa decemlineata]
MSAVPKYGFCAEDVIKEGRTTKSNIEAVKKWLSYNTHIPPMSDEQIVLFLLACDNDVEFTQRTIENFFKQKAASPELFANRDIDLKENQYQHTITYFTIFPKRTKENCVVTCGSLRNTTYYKWSIEPQIKTAFTLIDTSLYSNPPNGLIFILDLKGVGLMHLSRLKLGPLKKFFAYLQEALPVKLKQVHIMNASYIFEKLLAITKPFMKQELYDLIVSHPPDTKMEEFFENYIPASCMPVDFGGELPSLEQMSEDFQNQCRKLKTFLQTGEKQVELYKKDN